MPRMARNALQPLTDRWIPPQIETALFRHVGVCVERNVGNGIVITHQIRRAQQLLLHHVKGMIAVELLGLVFLTPLFRHPQIDLDVPRHGNERLVAVLLEELPLQHLSAQARIGRKELAAVGQVVQDGIGLP